MSKIAFQGQGRKVRLLCQGLPGSGLTELLTHVLLDPLCPSPQPQTKCSALQRMLNCLSSRSAPKKEKKNVLEQWEMEGREWCSLRWLMAPEIRAFEGWNKEQEMVSVEKRERDGEGGSRRDSAPEGNTNSLFVTPEGVLALLGGSNRKTVWGSVF